MTWERPPQGPSDWSRRYRDQDTPWDVGGPHPELARRLASRDLAPLRPGENALVPGAGRGYDAVALARAGWSVTALDFADGTRGEATRELERLGGRFLEVDALTYDGGPYDLVFDHTFFCAIAPSERPRWGQTMERVVADDGRLVLLVFPGGKPRDAGGPPFAMELDDVRAVLPSDFELVCDEPAAQTLARREWRESWAVFQRRGAGHGG
jgi:SAM-dependent methyltransferase